MESLHAMNGGEGPNSYFRNSIQQEARIDQAKALLISSIEEKLELQKATHIFTIGDLGCSVGPNTFKCVANLIEAVQHKYTNQGHDLKLPEFHVFFNNHVSNDFNNLFKSLPSDRQYKVAGVPGSFHGRVFPKSSMNLMHSSNSISWLSKVPEEVRKEDSPLWNKGRITYAWSSIDIMDAFRNQFMRDLEAFLLARSPELIPGGLLAILIPCRAEETLPSDERIIQGFEYLGDAINDMVKEGVVSEYLVDSFNVPLFIPTPSEVNQVVSSIKHLRTEKLVKMFTDPKLGTAQGIEKHCMHIRAVSEDLLCKHFGSNILDEVFNSQGKMRGREMESPSAMKGGEGPNSYFRNSTIQGARIDEAKVLLISSIEEALVLQKDTHIFTIADLGCSVGPNTFTCVENLIEAVQRKYTNQGHDLKLPEFHVFFNDHISNDFNTLFKSLPSDKQYMVAGVPGSFHGRVFPKSSMNLMHSSTSLQWLSKVPKEVREEDSPLWNKGRITYAGSSIQVMEAFRNQFVRDLEAFLLARSEELVPGGLLAILMPCRPEGTLPSEDYYVRIFEALGKALNDMVKEDLVTEFLLDSFNLPIFTPTASDVNQVVLSTKCLQTEKFEKISYARKLDSPQAIEYVRMHTRAVLEDLLSRHFGSDILDELFNRYLKKLQDFSNTLILQGGDPKIESLFMLVKLSDVSS